MDDLDFLEQRKAMIATIADHALLSARVTGRPEIDSAVIEAMLEVPRHRFVPESMRAYAYSDRPLPIGHAKTISQPFIVALMVDLLQLAPTDRVLEIGTGLGYQTAVLSRLAGEVYSVDIISELASEATLNLEEMNYGNTNVRIANGQYGWAENAPFDKIIVAASSDSVPNALYDQLSSGGRLVMPVGTDDNQNLTLAKKQDSTIETFVVLPVRFSRMVVVH